MRALPCAQQPSHRRLRARKIAARYASSRSPRRRTCIGTTGRCAARCTTGARSCRAECTRPGVTCSDCHDPHSLKLKADGNAVCAQCHLPAKYDAPSHTHHAIGTPGAACATCHMPTTTYMVVDPRHDHSMRIPRPDLSVQLGTPNACTNCHAKKSAQWAADAIAKWTGKAAGGIPAISRRRCTRVQRRRRARAKRW